MRLEIEIKIDYHKFQPDTLTKIIDHKFNVLVLQKYGKHERGMKKLDESNSKMILTHWDEYWSILIKGKNKFYFMLDIGSGGQIYGGGGCDFALKNMDLLLSDLIQLISVLNKDGALIFATINTKEIHDQRHKVVTKFKSGGSATGWEGSSNWDFLEYLPGVGWYTFFGKEYVQSIGKDKLLKLDSVIYCETLNSSIAFHLKKNIAEVYLKDMENVEKQIGELHFFNKERDKTSLSHPEKFKKFLVSLEKKFKEKYP